MSNTSNFCKPLRNSKEPQKRLNFLSVAAPLPISSTSKLINLLKQDKSRRDKLLLEILKWVRVLGFNTEKSNSVRLFPEQSKTRRLEGRDKLAMLFPEQFSSSNSTNSRKSPFPSNLRLRKSNFFIHLL